MNSFPECSFTILADGQSKNASFRWFARGHRDFVLRTASTRFFARWHWHAACHLTDWILFLRDQLVRALLKEDMGRGFTVSGRFLRGKTLCYYLGSAMALALAGLVAFLTFTPNANHEDESKEVDVETFRAPGVFPLSFQSSVPSASYTNRESSYRPVYPYSIIPGGIRSVKELKNAIAQDPLVKAHYRGFDLAKARIVRLTKDKTVHVSYRRGSQIYWTKKRITLFKGETLITDGKNTSRTRCGNRISDGPVIPSSPDEPPPSVFDVPVVPPTAPFLPPYDSPLPTPGGSVPIVPIIPPTPPGGSVPIVPIVPIFPGGGSPPPVGTKPPNPISVPEPGTFYLLIVSLPIVWLALKKRGS